MRLLQLTMKELFLSVDTALMNSPTFCELTRSFVNIISVFSEPL